uniref:Uncharacterized protein n=1 Tax=Oryza brachyantha TaxID=4533 RepID=J3MEB0_ORYBR
MASQSVVDPKTIKPGETVIDGLVPFGFMGWAGFAQTRVQGLWPGAGAAVVRRATGRGKEEVLSDVLFQPFEDLKALVP